ncbi:predicted protein [Naegleria gruberi]|uniref:Predicted protein n=1 Tax=Naegleria gruberi TaxID=5762 RepID=D2VCX6_NAEGR|nr:uncharacterized protein NAEGRDRAFT_48531 [Naegleria gruberi]EFC45380.1 predicted protein [Naegleria gruberi]|eukprot:XP_002678124.1 predicted protein [Naegleria gruberi strain NEG-M]
MTSEQGYTAFFEFIQNYIKNTISLNSPRSPTSSDTDSNSNSNSGRVSHRTATSAFPIVRKRFQQLSISEYTFMAMMNDLKPNSNPFKFNNNNNSSNSSNNTFNNNGNGNGNGLSNNNSLTVSNSPNDHGGNGRIPSTSTVDSEFIENDDDYYQISFDEYQLLDLFDILDVKGKGTISIESVYMFLCLFVCREGKLLTKFLYQFGEFVYDTFCSIVTVNEMETNPYLSSTPGRSRSGSLSMWSSNSPNNVQTKNSTGVTNIVNNISQKFHQSITPVSSRSTNSSPQHVAQAPPLVVEKSSEEIDQAQDVQEESSDELDYYESFDEWTQHEDIDLDYYSKKRSDFLKLAMLIGFDDMTIVNHVNELQNLILKNRAQKTKQQNITLKREDFMFIYYSVFKEFDNPNTRSSSSSASSGGVIKRKKRKNKALQQSSERR